MKSRRVVALLVFAATFMSVLPTAAYGQAMILNADNGISERVSGRNGKLPARDLIAFIWEPELQRSIALYALVATCTRQDFDGFYLGTNKGAFKNLRITGLSSQNWIKVNNKAVKLRGGIPKKMAVWDITNAVDTALVRDGLALVEGTVNFNKAVNQGDLVTCGTAIIEVDMRFVRAAETEEERLRIFEEAAAKTAFRHLTGPPAE